MATADITVLPIGREGASVGDLLVEVEKHLAAQDSVRYELHAMGTSLEGELEDILRIAGELHSSMSATSVTPQPGPNRRRAAGLRCATRPSP